ncbi:elongation factor P [Exiguobacterium indicum]|uniref:elongation factor P n=1 Tax=Exiguobacterium indicum TaxID=296995 RepID=UPI0007376734|nr:elongation factor P [Exiguobacterium indicum]KTR60727.1 elongation factor P [Exiguobacterium indicum]
MVSVNDLKTGLTIKTSDGMIWQVLEFQHVKPGKGAAFVRTKMRNIRNGNIQEMTFRGGERVERAHIERNKMQYLYPMGETYVFMDTESYEQLELTTSQVEAALPYLLENMEVQIAVYNGEILGLELPNTVVMTIVEAEPGVKGDTASNVKKNATVETGHIIQVPLFIEAGEKVTVDTRTGDFTGRYNG